MGLCVSTKRVTAPGKAKRTPTEDRRKGRVVVEGKKKRDPLGGNNDVRNNKEDGDGDGNRRRRGGGRGGVVPCGKRTDFGYDKDFDRRYSIGKLLGHGQFGYTYVATDKEAGDRVAVKRIEKNKASVFFLY